MSTWWSPRRHTISYGLRDYGTATWEGGDAGCDHREAASGATLNKGNNDMGHVYKDVCKKCGARRIDAQIGLEPTPDAYIATLVAVFREVRRVLRPDGTVFLNIGDSYSGGGGFSPTAPSNIAGSMQSRHGSREYKGRTPAHGYKPKDLMLMPARLALALQADGWYVRSQMPWIKRSCMPESATDRPTSSVEYVYMLTKQPRYFFDSEAVKRAGAIPAGTRAAKGSNVRSELKDVNGRPPEYWDYTGTRQFRNSDLFFDSLEPPHGLVTDGSGDPLALDVNTAGFADAHFATFPAKLVEPLIRASTSERGCCAACGAPWVRQGDVSYEGLGGNSGRTEAVPGINDKKWNGGGYPRMSKHTTTTGWAPSCHCPPSDPIPCTVLDPFFGAGTVGLVSSRLQRDCVGIELSADYAKMALNRIEKDAGFFSGVEAQPAASPQILADVPSNVPRVSEVPDSSGHRLAYSGHDDAQSSLWE